MFHMERFVAGRSLGWATDSQFLNGTRAGAKHPLLWGVGGHLSLLSYGWWCVALCMSFASAEGKARDIPFQLSQRSQFKVETAAGPRWKVKRLNT